MKCDLTSHRGFLGTPWPASQPKLIRTTLTALSLFGFVLAGSSVASGDALSGEEKASLIAPATRDGAWLNFALTDLMDGNTGKALLTSRDVELYRAAFEAQSHGQWQSADQAIAGIADKRLLGHLLAQRYLAAGYTTTYTELKTWLGEYSDLPEAGRIHALAIKRRPQAEHGGLGTPQASNGLQGGIAAAAIMGSGNYQSWNNGLEAFRQRDYALAFDQFSELARNRNANPWDQTAGAFWAARCLTRMGRPAEVTAWLRRASAHPRTFYGLLATRQLGTETELNWAVPDLRADHLASLSGKPAGSRALALLQVGQLDMAEDELRSIHPRGDDNTEEALIALANTANLPGLAMRLGSAIPGPNGALYDAALYPMPSWQPEDGFKVDRALIYALVRQESQFNNEARSRVGAAGLMQLMPRTASYIAGRSFNSSNIADLNDPELNLTLGQKYVEYLLQQGSIDNNLFYLLAAYNSGPGMVRQWQRNLNYDNDPLLFIETISATETRDFIERVLANYWIYQLQMGRETPSLETAASGDWPIYTPPEGDGAVRMADAASLN